MAFVGSGFGLVSKSGGENVRVQRGRSMRMVLGNPIGTDKKCVIRVEEKNGPKEIQVAPGTNLRTALRENGVDLYTFGGKFRNCGGNGACGLCTVNVTGNTYNLSPMNPKEEFMLANKPISWRLACRAEVSGDITVETKPTL
uniref:2Fe-2S ferredoxin-type domain-containing protein n=1 Tax=Timspurckia oligopyrenoides TaxID=708627 RepID=A0A7S0ZHJ0_9RHOD|mmetsp:Transcript_5527/g.9735  ORF Transcript_5527/g.9735 Transcript_5527/m.9735 type:complete len:142 (+) Transcript_5527:1131-1556(+)|eukprot:CAMPEP_0182443546 /NCGR_PEP_ID=MMETSP1172-20130603/2255_1 /TAXON_ID=708627 /ORGANISM="Timspurckia oligopyrenoides, Strain CCMP3278" /LENGTH=141 /DNA_ID=CAMNT_0024638863 /DNA_START=1125 /DNA_END=1550 /DNA_ORIENTATION=+